MIDQGYGFVNEHGNVGPSFFDLVRRRRHIDAPRAADVRDLSRNSPRTRLMSGIREGRQGRDPEVQGPEPRCDGICFVRAMTKLHKALAHVCNLYGEFKREFDETARTCSGYMSEDDLTHMWRMKVIGKKNQRRHSDLHGGDEVRQYSQEFSDQK